ncbi:LamG-like jellyroll fold domain-containing protein [Pedobacter arcticus]|uniref:LamG-like jellyroll fold domain-containing protein n=1 Tax=Pedobacter arcticus TaxID=752140 RepID=UPI0003139366|nr:LamG-like jellyroll fold domain-containing protein [Pedobacter arcticus]
MSNKTFFLSLFLIIVGINQSIAQTGNYLLLDGASYMRVANSATVNVPNASSFTLTCWANLTSADSRIISKRLGGAISAYELITSGSKQYGANISDAAGGVGPAFSTTTVGGAWHHLAMVIDRTTGTCSVYIDGVLEKSKTDTRTVTGDFANTQDLLIGVWNNSGTLAKYSIGKLDNIRLWSTAFTASQLQADMTAIVNTATTNLLAGWDFESVSGSAVADISGNSNKGTLSGNATVAADGNMTYSSASLTQTVLSSGIGAANQRVLAVNVSTNGSASPISLSSLTFSMNGTTNISDVDNIKVYYNKQKEKLDLNTAILLGSVSPASGDLTVNGSQVLSSGYNYFFITYDVAENATEGNLLDAEVKSIVVGGASKTISPTATAGSRTILLTTTLVYQPGDAMADSYRIPAIATAKDGSLITAIDKRNNSDGDLRKNGNIDITIRRSTDKGATWSAALTIAGDGTNYCYSDPSLVVDKSSGDILCLFNGNTSYGASNASDYVHLFQSRSTDNGITWSAATDITDQIYGANCSNPISKTWLGLFISSGSLTQLNSGRILGVMPVRELSGNTGDFVLYTDDVGLTWNVSTNNAVPTSGGNGNEAKTVQLDDESILMSIRTYYTRRFNTSTDNGVSWGTAYNNSLTDPGCNGDLIRYTSVKNGYNKSRLIHSLPYSPGNTTRKDVSLYVSYDEGVTWPIRKTIDPQASAYSSVCILNDGTIGIFYEDGEYGASYNLYFSRLSLKWLSDGADIYEPKVETKRPTPNHSLKLNGTNSYMSVANTTSLNITPTQGFTLSAWVKIDPTQTSTQRIFSKRNGTGKGYELFTANQGGNFGKLGFNLSSPSSGGAYGTTAVNNNQWHHVAIVVNPNDNTTKHYIDGVLNSTNTSANISNIASDFSNTENLLFGAYNNSGTLTHFMKGEIDDIHIWSSALSQTDINTDLGLNVGSLATKPNDLIAAYDFENITTASITDVTGKSNTGTLMGGAVLPLHFLSFTGKYNAIGETIAFNWQTTNEVNVKAISLERTNDGKNYTTIYTTSPKGQALNNYNFTHQPNGDLQNQAYYRVKIIDYNNSVIYSDNTLSFLAGQNSKEITLYPNPTTETVFVNTTLKAPITVSIYNSKGDFISSSIHMSENFSVDVSTLANGVYLLKASNSVTSKYIKFIKK